MDEANQNQDEFTRFVEIVSRICEELLKQVEAITNMRSDVMFRGAIEADPAGECDPGQQNQ